MVRHILFWNDSLHCCNCLSLPCNSCNQLIVLGFSLTETRPMILFVVWSANSDGSAALTSKASSNLLNDGTYHSTYRCVCAGNCVVHSDK